MIHYELADDLFVVADAALETCRDSPVTNLLVAYNLDIDVVDSQFVEVHGAAASQWMSDPHPAHLPFSHAEYYRGSRGLAYLESQLRRNGTRRALLSLVATDDLIEAQPDGPLPSFMILQVAISDDDVLMLTAYYRALEVSTFFRTNLAEICLHARWIRDRFPRIRRMSLVVLAFQAYVDDGFTLAIPLIDRQPRGVVATTAQAGDVATVQRWLRDKADSHSNFSSDGLNELLVGLERWPECPQETQDAVRRGVEAVARLRDLRVAHTEGPQMEGARAALRDALSEAVRSVGRMV